MRCTLVRLAALAAVLAGCSFMGGGSPPSPPDPGDEDGDADAQNHAPVAAVGAAQTVRPGVTVVLDGSSSNDPDGDALTYNWIQIDGTPVELTDATGSNPTFIAPTLVNATLGFRLVVDDGFAASTPVIAAVTVQTPLPSGFAAQPFHTSLPWPDHGATVAAAGNYVYVGDPFALSVVDVTLPSAPYIVARLALGSPRAIRIVGDYAYLTVFPASLVIVDVSSPTAPTVVSTYDTTLTDVNAVLVSGGYAYVSDGATGVHVIDVSDVAAPLEVGVYDTPGYAHEVALDDDLLIVADGAALIVLDVSVPEAPAYVGEYASANALFEVRLVAGYAYAAGYGSELEVVDLSTPSVPARVGGLPVGSLTNGRVDAAGGTVYFLAGATLSALDVSTPASPEVLGSYVTDVLNQDFCVQGDYAYVVGDALTLVKLDGGKSAVVARYDFDDGAHAIRRQGDNVYLVGEGGFAALDMTAPLAPVPLGYAPVVSSSLALAEGRAFVGGGLGALVLDVTSAPAIAGEYGVGWVTNLAVDSGALYATADQALHVLDLATPPWPSLLSVCADCAPSLGGLAFFSHYAYAPAGELGLAIIDTNTTPPSAAAAVNTSGWAYDVLVHNGYAYVADGDDGVVILSLANPEAPAVVGGYDTPGVAERLWFYGDTLYVADAFSLQILYVDDPEAPSFVGSYTAGVTDVRVADSHAYLAAQDLVILDVSDASAPVLVTSLSAPDPVVAVDLVGNHAYLGLGFDYSSDGGQGGFAVADVSNPAAPVLTSSFALGTAVRVRGVGERAYVASTAGLLVVDVHDPSAARLLGRLPLPGTSSSDGATDVAVVGDVAYVTGGTAGLEVVDVSEPMPNAELGVYDAQSVSSVAAVPDRAYVTRSHDFAVLDTSVVADIREQGALALPNPWRVVAATGDYAYVSSFTSGPLWIVDVSDPAHPSVASALPTPVNAVRLSADRAYVVSETALRVLDVHSPSAPFWIGYYAVPDVTAADVELDLPYAYLATSAGLRVLELIEPTLSETSPGSYTVSWSGVTTPEVTCAASAGSCEVTDLGPTQASVSWTVPEAPGTYTLDVAVGNWNSFASARAEVTVD